MLDEYEMDKIIQPIVDIYNKLELELLKEIAARLETYDGVSGSLEWYLDKVKEMGILNENAIKIISRYSSLSEKAIKDILEKAQYGSFDLSVIEKAYNKKIIHLSPEQLIENEIFKETLMNSYVEINKSFRLIQTKALESTQQRYMDVINKSYIEVSSGTYDYNSSIRNAIKQMANKGITGITYKRKDGSIVNYSIEAAVRRDTLTATHKLCNANEMEKIKLLGAEYVEVSSHIGARVSKDDPIANHAGWQGKVYKLNGSDDEYENFYEKTGYGDILGLGGVNCRHLFSAFFPGISKPVSVQYDQEENEKYYKLTQKQRKYEREIRKLKKERACYEKIGDEEEVKKVNKEIRSKSKKLNVFCEKNGLKRDRNREVVANE